MRRLARVTTVPALVAACIVTAGGASAADGAATPAPTVRDLVGQRLVVAIGGTTPSAAVLGRIRRGEIGGVILFGANVRSQEQLRRLTGTLQGAARAAGRPALLVATDQEGGSVRRLPWAGPESSGAALGRLSSVRIEREALLAGRALMAAGVNVDLAPVADVPGPGSFMALEGRTLGATRAAVSRAAAAFTRGLSAAGVAAGVKHFPGIGLATRNTDRAAVEIRADPAMLAADLEPFRAVISAGAPIVMISNASYPALDAKPAPWSARVQSLLRNDLGFRGVTVTDALDGAAATRGRALEAVAVLAAQTGIDLLLLTGSEASSERVFRRLVLAAEDGRLPKAALVRSHDRIVALKRSLAP